jgi:hypothetical protein
MKSQQSEIGAFFPSGWPVRDGDGRMIKDSCSPQKNSQRSCNQAVQLDRPENRCAILHASPLDHVIDAPLIPKGLANSGIQIRKVPALSAYRIFLPVHGVTP